MGRGDATGEVAPYSRMAAAREVKAASVDQRARSIRNTVRDYGDVAHRLTIPPDCWRISWQRTNYGIDPCQEIDPEAAGEIG
jgi:hypothetical protein